MSDLEVEKSVAADRALLTAEERKLPVNIARFCNSLLAIEN